MSSGETGDVHIPQASAAEIEAHGLDFLQRPGTGMELLA